MRVKVLKQLCPQKLNQCSEAWLWVLSQKLLVKFLKFHKTYCKMLKLQINAWWPMGKKDIIFNFHCLGLKLNVVQQLANRKQNYAWKQLAGRNG